MTRMNNDLREQANEILHVLLESGAIKVQGGEYIGHAADGTWVNIGDVGLRHRDSIYRYLLSHRTPDTW